MSRSDDQHWQCPACGQRLTTHVPLKEDPRCMKHTGGGRKMQQVQRKR